MVVTKTASIWIMKRNDKYEFFNGVKTKFVKKMSTRKQMLKNNQNKNEEIKLKKNELYKTVEYMYF